MSSSSSNNMDGDAWLMHMELRREDAEGATMEEDEGDSLEDHPLTSERGTLASISLFPIPINQQGLQTTMKTKRFEKAPP